MDDAIRSFFWTVAGDIHPYAQGVLIDFFVGDVADLRVNIVAALQVLEAKENADDMIKRLAEESAKRAAQAR